VYSETVRLQMDGFTINPVFTSFPLRMRRRTGLRAEDTVEREEQIWSSSTTDWKPWVKCVCVCVCVCL